MNFNWLFGLILFVQPVTVSNSLTIEKQGETISVLEKADYEFPLPGTPLINIEKYNDFLKKMDWKTYKPPQNAFIDDTGKVIEGQKGEKLHRKAFTDKFYTYLYHKDPSVIELPMLSIPPRVDRDLLLHIRVKEIGYYITYFNKRNKARSHDIELAAEAIDNYVIFPKETFSFNKVVGKRTSERGYLRAPVIVRGELSEDIGGGICQVSSTLFNAADRAGLNILERYSHSKKVPYVPPGRDATVSWYGPDFTFKNLYSFPLLIRSRVIGGQMIIKIFSSDEIDYESRPVPEASKMLPEEIDIENIKLQSEIED